MEVKVIIEQERRWFNHKGEVTKRVWTFAVYRDGTYIGTAVVDSWGKLAFDLTITLSIDFLKQVIPQLELFLEQEE